MLARPDERTITMHWNGLRVTACDDGHRWCGGRYQAGDTVPRSFVLQDRRSLDNLVGLYELDDRNGHEFAMAFAQEASAPGGNSHG